LVIKLPKKLSREAAARLGSEHVAPGPVTCSTAAAR